MNRNSNENILTIDLVFTLVETFINYRNKFCVELSTPQIEFELMNHQYDKNILLENFNFTGEKY